MSSTERFFIQPEDYYLLQPLTVYGPAKFLKDQVITQEPFLKTVFSLLGCFPSNFTGSVDPRAILGISFISGKLGQPYNLRQNQTQGLKTLSQDYFRTVAKQAQEGTDS